MLLVDFQVYMPMQAAHRWRAHPRAVLGGRKDKVNLTIQESCMLDLFNSRVDQHLSAGLHTVLSLLKSLASSCFFCLQIIAPTIACLLWRIPTRAIPIKVHDAKRLGLG